MSSSDLHTPFEGATIYDRAMRYVVEPGHISLYIGSSSNDIRLSGRFGIVGSEPREMRLLSGDPLHATQRVP
jgi:hypothetical protein